MMTRRDCLKLALAAGAAFGLRSLWAQQAQDLITRAIPSSGERLPVVGLGSSASFSRLAGEDPDTETWAEPGETVAHHVDAACDPGRLLRQNLGGGRDDGEYCVHLLSSFLPLPWVSSDL